MNAALQQLCDYSTEQFRKLPRICVGLLAMTSVGCSRSPAINILGSYFPSWLVCVGIAIGLTFLAHIYVAKKKLAEHIWPLPVIYGSLLCLFSCGLWLTFFQ
jgi:hypothetical protein